MAYELVVIGTSWGGLHALRRVLGGLPANFDLPVVVVQHRHRDSDHLLVSLLQDHTALTVHEIEDKTPLAPGGVYVAPAEYHVLVEVGQLQLSTEEPVRFSRPSIDVALETAAEAYGRSAIGVVLTGANDDGAAGLAAVRRRGGMAIVQDPATAEGPAMPAAAIASAAPQWVLPIEAVAERLVVLSRSAARETIG